MRLCCNSLLLVAGRAGMRDVAFGVEDAGAAGDSAAGREAPL